jgi:hypothetical protein
MNMWAAAVAAVLTFVAAVTGPFDQAVRDDLTVLVGDSITALHVDAWANGLGRCIGPTVVDGQGGRRTVSRTTIFGYIDSGLQAVQEINASGADPTTWVIELGTWDTPVPGQATEFIDTLLAEIEPSDTVIWVAPYASGYLQGSTAFRAALLATDRVIVADWYSHAVPYMVDSVHPNDAGISVMIGLVCAAAAA